MKRILKVTGIVVGTVVAVTVLVITVFCAVLGRDFIDALDDYVIKSK